MKQAYNNQSGAATLPTVILLSLLTIALGIGLTAVSLDEGLATVSEQQASQAQVYAESGAKDALLRIARNKSYTCSTTDCYTIDMATSGCSSGTACAKVTVSAGTGAGGDPKVITSKGQVNSNIRSVQVNVLLDSALNGQIATTTWTDLTN